MDNVGTEATELTQQMSTAILVVRVLFVWNMVEKNAFVTKSWMGRTTCEDRRRDTIWHCLSWIVQFLRYDSKHGLRWQGPINLIEKLNSLSQAGLCFYKLAHSKCCPQINSKQICEKE